MENLTGLFNETAFVVLSVIIQAIIVILGTVLITFVSKLGKKAGLDANDSIMKEIVNLVNNIVVATNQKVVDKLKEESPTGSLTEEQQEMVFNSVKDAIIVCLTTDQVKYLTDNYLSVENGITYFIESAVKYNHSDENILISGVEHTDELENGVNDSSPEE